MIYTMLAVEQFDVMQFKGLLLCAFHFTQEGMLHSFLSHAGLGIYF